MTALLFAPRSRGLQMALAAGALALGVAAASRVIGSRQSQAAEATVAAERTPIRTVTALGRLEPVGAVRTIAPPSATGGGAVRIRELLVEEGDRVRRGQVLAVLDTLPRLTAAEREAEAEERLAAARLAIARADQRDQETGQRAEVDRLDAELRRATAEDRRYQLLRERGAVSASEQENRRLRRDTAAAELREARSRLQRLQSLTAAGSGTDRLDVAAAERELERATAARERASSEREDGLVRAPLDGRVLTVLTRAGEAAGSGGLLELGSTDRMQVVAEVYQSDRGRVRLGQPVRIESPALPMPLQGRVSRIGAIVRRQAIVNADPSANVDNRVVEVRATLGPRDSARAATLSNLQVTAVIGR